MKFANAYEALLGPKNVISNLQFCKMLEIGQQDCQVVRFCKLRKNCILFQRAKTFLDESSSIAMKPCEFSNTEKNQCVIWSVDGYGVTPDTDTVSYFLHCNSLTK